MSVSLKFLLAGVAKFSGSTVTFTFEPKQTIAEAKESIIRQWPEHLREVDIARKKMRIVHAGTVLDDKQTLQDYNFVDTDSAPTLHLMLQPMQPQEEQKSTGAGAAEQPGGKPVGRCCVIA